MSAKLHLEGEVFGRLTVLYRMPEDKRNAWMCQCVCGKTKMVAQHELRNGDTKSCGCLKKEIMVKRNETHGMAKTKVYKKWAGMLRRTKATHTERNKCYIGVVVCDRWKIFEN